MESYKVNYFAFRFNVNYNILSSFFFPFLGQKSSPITVKGGCCLSGRNDNVKMIASSWNL